MLHEIRNILDALLEEEGYGAAFNPNATEEIIKSDANELYNK
jgi:hypothetical protein